MKKLPYWCARCENVNNCGECPTHHTKEHEWCSCCPKTKPETKEKVVFT